VDGSFLNRWASWVARWLVASPVSAFRACAETSVRGSAPLLEPCRGRQEVRCATLTVPVDCADPGRGFRYDMNDSLEDKRSERRAVDVDEAALVIGCNDSARGASAAQQRAEDARPATTYPRFGKWWPFRGIFLPGGHAC
jgi:hypothetical protein